MCPQLVDVHIVIAGGMSLQAIHACSREVWVVDSAAGSTCSIRQHDGNFQPKLNFVMKVDSSTQLKYYFGYNSLNLIQQRPGLHVAPVVSSSSSTLKRKKAPSHEHQQTQLQHQLHMDEENPTEQQVQQRHRQFLRPKKMPKVDKNTADELESL